MGRRLPCHHQRRNEPRPKTAFRTQSELSADITVSSSVSSIMDEFIWRMIIVERLTKGAGPLTTRPWLLYWEPWHGQMNLFSAELNGTTQPRWVHTALMAYVARVLSFSTTRYVGSPWIQLNNQTLNSIVLNLGNPVNMLIFCSGHSTFLNWISSY